MKFKAYINETKWGSMNRPAEGRSKPISIDKAKLLMEKNCKKILKHYKKGTTVISRKNFNFRKNNAMITDPTKGRPRKSVNTYNWYTMLIDELMPEWSKYPKRSKSIIARVVPIRSFKDGYTPELSDEFIVMPYDKCELGMCPQSDIWISFKGADYVDMVVDLVASIFTTMGENPREIEDDPKKFKELTKSIYPETNHAAESFFDKYDKWSSNDLYELLINYFQPNGFKHLNMNNLNSLEKFKEVWVGKGPSIMIKDSDLLKEIFKWQ